MISLPKEKTKKPKKTEYPFDLYEKSRCGDMAGFQIAIESYWSDKKQYPLHRLYKVIEKYWEQENPDIDLSGALILIRDGIFASLDILSLSLALEVPTEELVHILCKEKSFKDGRRKVRNYCANLAKDMIETGEVGYLTETGLKRDGFEYLTPKLKDKHIEIFKAARPVEKDGQYSLSRLLRSKYGKMLLRELEVTKNKIDASDLMAKEILERYDHMLIEIELDTDPLPDIEETQQLTLNGEPIEEKEMDKKSSK